MHVVADLSADELWPGREPSRVLVLTTALDGHDRLFAPCLASQRAYCEANGYEHLVVTETPRTLDPNEATWLKVPLIEAALDTGRYSWVAYLDADCEVDPGAPPFAEHLDSIDPTKSVFVAHGRSGQIDSGVVFTRGTPAGLGFFGNLLGHADDSVPAEDEVGPGVNGHVIHHGRSSPDVFLLEHRLWNNDSSVDGEAHVRHYNQGPMRRWYMANLASPAARRKWRLKRWLGSVPTEVPLVVRLSRNAVRSLKANRLVRRVFRRHVPPANGPAPQAVMVKQAMASLMPFYRARYAQFRH